ncbi:Hypothetical predicted protein [Octopus vulgaris]|uniref:Uncharacterized protein n=1 Tax=Octopus vulgaris TaxID=6645 RepID=A0AA36FJV2_OCTVU|nr:Hypothetical predicted protein [Octopus vulgaris]
MATKATSRGTTRACIKDVRDYDMSERKRYLTVNYKVQLWGKKLASLKEKRKTGHCRRVVTRCRRVPMLQRRVVPLEEEFVVVFHKGGTIENEVKKMERRGR